MKNLITIKNRSPIAAAVISAIATLGSTGVCVQAAETDSEYQPLEEIVVSARKRDERLQDVPIAMTALSGDALQDSGINNVLDVLEVIPSTTFEPGDDRVSANVTLRGVNRSLRSDEPAFGLYRDGVYVGGQISALPEFMDLASVEVLRGPQGGLYGRNAAAGAINFTSAAPEAATLARLDMKVANLDRQEIQAMFNTPLMDESLLMRVAVLYEDQDRGFNYNPVLDQELDASENAAARIRLKWEASEDLDFLLTLETSDKSCTACGLASVITDTEAGGAAFAIASIPGLGPVDLAEPITGLDEDDLRNNARDFKDSLDVEQDIVILEGNYTTDMGTYTGIASYRTMDIEGQRDNDHSILGDKTDRRNIEQDSFFLELRFASELDGPFSFLAGINYFAEDRVYDTDQLVRIFPGIVGGDFTSGDNAFNVFLRDYAGLPVVVRQNLIGPGFGVEGATLEDGSDLPVVTDGNGFSGESGASFLADTNNDQELESVSVFIEANYDPTDQLNIWGSLRYTRDEKSIDFAQLVDGCDFACHGFLRNVLGLNQVFLDDGVTIDTSTSQLVGLFEDTVVYSSWSPGAGVTYRPDEDMTLYGKVVTGFKAGGFNENAGKVEDLPLDEEKSIGYEIGTNLQLFNGSTALRLAAFYHERRDTVIAVDDPSFPAGTNLIGASNADVDTWGVEIELASRPLEGLELNATLGYLDAEFKTFEASRNGASIDLAGNKVPLVYDWTASLQAIYRHPLSGFDDLNLFYYGLYTTKQDGWLDEDNTAEADDIHRVNLKLGVEGVDWRLVAFADNVFDRVDIAYQNPRDQFRTYTPARTYGLQFSMDFDF
ncbi:TonB-dependent receptor [Pseudomaricurvus alkylphenolicus]|uniref:TonB-dependent receptor n=1 Tax=Pseudomaricurvus alkylphenolicus TaxID=1306991 RepID=UPI001420D4AE|nr:TonB-dependent receptor [Pseudomaricurvus alkylphenolicus]NIB38318.1 TonB-dependent receptor [Pseudomaricurvus alkylphenolicus]